MPNSCLAKQQKYKTMGQEHNALCRDRDRDLAMCPISIARYCRRLITLRYAHCYYYYDCDRGSEKFMSYQEELFQKFPQVADKIWWAHGEGAQTCLCAVEWFSGCMLMFALTAQNGTLCTRSVCALSIALTENTCVSNDDICGPNCVYATFAAGTFNRDINIIKLHAINAICCEACQSTNLPHAHVHAPSSVTFNINRTLK